MKRAATLTLAPLTALALAGCSVASSPNPPAPSATAESAHAPSQSAGTASPSPNAAHTSTVKFTGASEALAKQAEADYFQWDAHNSKASDQFRGAYKKDHIVLEPENDPGQTGEFVRILEWSARSENRLRIRLEGNQWTGPELKVPGTYVSCELLDDDQEFVAVTFTTENGETRGTSECRNP